MKEYYKNNPQLNRKKAFENFLQTQLLLSQQPFSGNKYENFDNVRELKILKSNYYDLRSKKVENLIHRFKKQDFKQSTLGGCIFLKKDQNLCLKIEKI